jgi:TetR/AcrR family transcriptional regulator
MKMQAAPVQGKELLILDAAGQRFASAGYSKSTMDEIAADVGMCKGSLYYYFPTKESVFRAVVQREHSEFLIRADVILGRTAPARVKVMDYVRLRLELAERLMNLNRIDQYAWHDIHPVFTELFQSFGAEEEQRLLRLFREGAASKEFALKQPKRMASLLLHVLQALRLRLVKLQKHSPISGPETREWREESLLFTETMLNGITTTTV